MEFIKHPHTAIFKGPTGVGKTHLVLNIIETQYNNNITRILIKLSFYVQLFNGIRPILIDHGS